MTLSPDASIGLGSAVIALCAFLVSIVQLRMQRTHDRLSVRPILDWTAHNTNHVNHKWEIINVGEGTAIITSFRLLVGKDEIVWPSSKIIVSALESIGITSKHVVKYYAGITPVYVMPHETKLLLELHEDMAVLELKEICLKIGWILEYESVYGEKFKLHIPNDAR
jgi:hypothetical protein